MRVNGILSVSSFCEVCSAVSQCEKLREWDGIFYVSWMRGRM